MNLKDLWPFKAPDADAALPHEKTASASSASLCAVFSSYSSVEAHIVSGMLEDNGIKCVLSNELFAAADSPVANATGGVQIFVRASDADQAQALLRQAEASKDVSSEDIR
jgi:hypothetical protein